MWQKINRETSWEVVWTYSLPIPAKLGPAAAGAAIGAAQPQWGCREEGEKQNGSSLELPNKISLEPLHSTRWYHWRASTPSHFTATWAVSCCLGISAGACRKPAENTLNLPSSMWEGRGWLWLWQFKIPGPCNKGWQLVNTGKTPSCQGFAFKRMRRHIGPYYLPCIFMLTLKVTVIWTHSCYIHKKMCLSPQGWKHKPDPPSKKTHQCADSQSSWEMASPFHSLAAVRRAAGCPEVQKCNVCYCRDLSADPKLLEAAPWWSWWLQWRLKHHPNPLHNPRQRRHPPATHGCSSSQPTVCSMLTAAQKVNASLLGWQAKHGVSISGGCAREGHQRTWLCTTRFLGNSCQLMHGQGVLLRSMPGT